MRRNRSSVSPLPSHRRAALAAAGAVALATALILPIFIAVSGHDPFRLPKTALLRTGGMLSILLLFAAVLRREVAASELWNWKRPVDRLLLAIVGVTLLTTLTSSLPSASWKACVTTVAVVGLFISARETLRVDAVLPWMAVPACLIALLACLSVAGWSPWQIVFPDMPDGVARHLMQGTLLGNRNDVGCYLSFLSIVFLSRAGVRPLLRFSISALLLAGVLASMTLTAALAALAGVVMILFGEQRRSRRPRALLAALVLIALAGSAIHLSDQLSSAAPSPVPLERATSQRWGAWLTAAAIGIEKPITGVGPGAFGKHFATKRVEVAEQDLGLFSTDHPRAFFSEAHSDFLQVFAELGLPGLAVLLWALVYLIREPRTRAPAVTFAVLAAALFPLQLAVVTGSAALWLGAEFGRGNLE